MRQGQREELQLFKITWQTSARKAARRVRRGASQHKLQALSPHSGNGSRRQCFAIATRSQPAAAVAATTSGRLAIAPWAPPGYLAPVQLALPALCPAVMNKNRINLRQSRFGFLRSFARSFVFFCWSSRAAPTAARNLNLSPAQAVQYLSRPSPLPAGCATFVSVYRVH